MKIKKRQDGGQRESGRFNFQALVATEISIDDALALAPRNDSKYRLLVASIADQLEKISPGKTIRYDLPASGNGHHAEVPESTRRGICQSVNRALRRRSINFRLTYSGVNKCFVAVPLSGKRSAIAPSSGAQFQDLAPGESERAGIILRLADAHFHYWRAKGPTGKRVGRGIKWMTNIVTKALRAADVGNIPAKRVCQILGRSYSAVTKIPVDGHVSEYQAFAAEARKLIGRGKHVSKDG